MAMSFFEGRDHQSSHYIYYRYKIHIKLVLKYERTEKMREYNIMSMNAGVILFGLNASSIISSVNLGKSFSVSVSVSLSIQWDNNKA